MGCWCKKVQCWNSGLDDAGFEENGCEDQEDSDYERSIVEHCRLNIPKNKKVEEASSV